MDSLDIQIVDSLTVNLNQEDYSTEGQILNDIAVYVEDEQLLFEAALTQDSINLYTRETPDIISFDTKEITDGISKLESLILKTSKEATLLAKVAELKEALNTIDFTAIEQAIQGVEDVTAREATLIQGVEDIIKAVENIDFTDLENSIAEVKNAVVNIDFSALAKEDTLTDGINTLSNKIDNIDLSSVENKVDEGVETLADKIDNIKLPEIDTTELAKEATLNAVSSKLDNINVEVDLSSVAKQGENQEATNSKMYETLNELPNRILDIIESKTTFPVSYDGAVCPYQINSIITAIDNRDNITKLTDDKIFELTKVWTEYGLPNVTILTLNILGKVVRRGFGGSSIKELYLPAFKYSDTGITQVFADANNLMKLSIPNATGFVGNYEFSSPYLIDLEIGKAFNSSQNFGTGKYGWNPKNAMSDDSNMVEDTVDEFGRAIVTNKDQLLYNIRRHFAANLRELTNGEGYYIAIGPIKDIIIDDEPTYSAFTNKGWTLA